MTITIRDTAEALDLPREMELQIEMNNSFFSQEGQYSLPLTLPPTPKNNRLLGFAERLDIATTTDNERVVKNNIEVMIQHGALQKQATLTLVSYTAEAGYECSIVFRESNIYSRLKGVTLKDVLRGYTYQNKAVQPRSRRSTNDARSIVETIKRRILSPTMEDDKATPVLHDEWEAFPVYTDKAIINRPYAAPVYDGSRTEPSGYEASIKNGTIQIGNDEVSGPVGFGMTVFLHLTYVLDKVFKYIDKELKIEYPTDSFCGVGMEEIFSRIVILNQTIDAIVPGTIYYETLVPEMECVEFLQTLFALFGFAVFDSPTGDVRGCFLHEVLKNTEAVSIEKSRVLKNTALHRAQIEYQSRRSVSISMEHTRQEGEVEQTDYEQLKANHYIPTTGIREVMTGRMDIGYAIGNSVGFYESVLQETELVREIYTGCIYTVKKKDDSDYYIYDAIVCRDQLDMNKFNLLPENLTDDKSLYEELSIENSYTDTQMADTTNDSDERYGDLFNLAAPVMPGLKNETITIQQTTTKDEKTSTKSLTQNDDCPLTLAYYAGMHYLSIRNVSTADSQRAVYGSPYWKAENFVTNPTQGIDLTARGIATTMHAEYDKRLREGMHALTVETWMAAYDIMNFDFTQPIMIRGRKYIPTSLQASISDEPLSAVTLKLLSI